MTNCLPCESIGQTLPTADIHTQFVKLTNWHTDQIHLWRDLSFKNFNQAISFINKVAGLANTQGHHPDINLHNFKFVTITLWTHALNGLTMNDFILANKIDKLL